MPFMVDRSWTTATYRAALALWRANAPARDSDIFAEAARSDRPRHGSLAKVLAPLLRFRTPPAVGMSSNWTLTAANDRPADFDAESAHEVLPSITHIKRQVNEGPVIRSSRGAISSIGTLQFSADHFGNERDAKREFAYFRGPDGKVISGMARLPLGAMLGQRERQKRTKGARQAGASGSAVAAMLKLPTPHYVTAGRCKPGRSVTAAKSAVELAAAYANTPVLPPIKKCAPGMASGSADLAAGFWCMRRVRPMPSPPTWSDDYAEASTWHDVLAALPDETRTALAAARTARGFEDIGNAHGFTGEYARKAGRRILIAANENFASIEKKLAA